MTFLRLTKRLAFNSNLSITVGILLVAVLWKVIPLINSKPATVRKMHIESIPMCKSCANSFVFVGADISQGRVRATTTPTSSSTISLRLA